MSFIDRINAAKAADTVATSSSIETSNLGVATALAAADALAAAISPVQALQATSMPSPEELNAAYTEQLASLYPENSYLMQTQKTLLLKNGGRILADVNGVITAANAEQREMLEYWDAKNEGLVLKLK